ncbi:MAG: geranylgeranylglycerol-phosphate geranylgeranyltransferase [Flavobacteriales bacterium]|nr:geranylgeranylglycerol-phosphate geranylgeranyltransferase [Flavobacteriales bacterium]
MRFIFDFLRLIRFPNLAIIALTQYAIRFGIIYPFLKQAELSLFLSEGLFALLVGATVLIAASGYIINDYFDVKLDHVNKPEQLIVGKSVSRRQAMFLHFLVNGIGISMAAYVAFSIHHPMLILIQLICAALLWFYSVNFKKQILIGNLIIAALTALVPFTAGYYEIAILFDQTLAATTDVPFEAHNFRSLLFNIQYLLYWIIGYSAFAFLLTLIREIIKDCEDIQGDEAFGCKTLPIVHGVDKAKKIANVIALFLLAALALLEYIQVVSKDWISFAYFFLLISLPLIWIIIQTNRAKEKKHFFVISQTIKVLMLIGILYTGIISLF